MTHFEPNVPLQVMKLIQIIAQARQTAKRISDQSSEAAASSSFLSWFGLSPFDLNTTFSGPEPEDSGECLKKTHEFLDRALENLCQIFKVGSASMVQFLKPLVRNYSRVTREPPSVDWAVLVLSSVTVSLQLNQGQLTQLLSNLGSSQDDASSRQLPDCVQGESGPVLTDLGRRQVSGSASGEDEEPRRRT